MKKIFKLLFPLFATFIFLFSGCSAEQKQLRFLEKTLSLDFSGATITRHEDSHGWFGDGETFIVCEVSHDFVSQLQYPSWKTAPVSEAICFLLESPGICEDEQTQEKLIPFEDIEYWFYVSDGPHNFYFAALDDNQNIFYYYEWDA